MYEAVRQNSGIEGLGDVTPTYNLRIRILDLKSGTGFQV